MRPKLKPPQKDSIVCDNRPKIVFSQKKKTLVRTMGCKKCESLDWRF